MFLELLRPFSVEPTTSIIHFHKKEIIEIEEYKVIEIKCLNCFRVAEIEKDIVMYCCGCGEIIEVRLC